MSIEIRLLSKMTDGKELARIYELGLRREVFVEEPIYGYAFDWMINYWLESNMAAAPTWVAMEMKFPTIALMIQVDESTDFLVSELKDRWVRNRMQTIIREKVLESEEDPQAAIKTLWQAAYAAAETVEPRYSRVDMATTVEARRQRYAHRHDRQDTGGVTLGLDALDAHTRGVLPGELVALAAYTKTGKTFYVLKAAIEARRKGHTPLIFTLEQSIPEIEDRIDALSSGVSYERLQEGTLLIPESAKLTETREEMAALGPLYVERPAKGERTVRGMCNRARQIGADYLIIDQLSYMDGEHDYRGDRAMTALHGDLISDLKIEISRDSAGLLPCLLAVQFNRDSQNTASGGRGALKNFAHSSMIEQTVDLALGLWRTSEARANNAMMLDIMGSRRSDLKSWALTWHLSERTEIAVQRELAE